MILPSSKYRTHVGCISHVILLLLNSAAENGILYQTRGAMIMKLSRNMTQKQSDTILENMKAQGAERKVQAKFEADKDQFLLDVMQGRVTVTQQVHDLFTTHYKAILQEGKYIGMRQGSLVISSKNPEKAVKQLAEFDEMISKIFTVA